MHHRDAVGHRHRLELVVGDVDHRRVQLQVEAFQLGAHLHPQLGVQIGERLVHQKRLRVADQRAAQRDALLLPAGELARMAVEEMVDAEDVGGPLHLRVELGLGDLAHAQRKGEVLEHRLVRVEGVVLEDHRQVAVLGIEGR